MLTMKKILMVLALLAPTLVHAEIQVLRKSHRHLATASEPVALELLPFKTWKDQKIIEAQNLTTRLSNRIVLLKAGKIKAEDLALEFPQLAGDSDQAPLTARAQKLQSGDLLARMDRELARSQKSLEFAHDLSLEEYAVGYLNQFQDAPEALAKMADRLSKEEMAELLKVLLRTGSPNLDTRKNERSKSLPAKMEANARVSSF